MSCSFFFLFPATLYHTSLPPFIFSMGHGRGPFSLLKNPLFVKNKEEAKANNKVRQSPFCQQSLTCYLECYQCWGGNRCRWERRTGRLLLLWEGKKKRRSWLTYISLQPKTFWLLFISKKRSLWLLHTSPALLYRQKRFRGQCSFHIHTHSTCMHTESTKNPTHCSIIRSNGSGCCSFI